MLCLSASTSASTPNGIMHLGIGEHLCVKLADIWQKSLSVERSQPGFAEHKVVYRGVRKA